MTTDKAANIGEDLPPVAIPTRSTGVIHDHGISLAPPVPSPTLAPPHVPEPQPAAESATEIEQAEIEPVTDVKPKGRGGRPAGSKNGGKKVSPTPETAAPAEEETRNDTNYVKFGAMLSPEIYEKLDTATQAFRNPLDSKTRKRLKATHFFEVVVELGLSRIPEMADVAQRVSDAQRRRVRDKDS